MNTQAHISGDALAGTPDCAKTVLALDLGTTTGWALREAGILSDKTVWRPIPDWPAYEVSSDGHVRRVRRSKGALAGCVLRPMRNKKTRYLSVCLCESPRSKRIDIHRLVALAFLGPQPSERHLVAHNDGSRTNNAVTNLRWATQSENLRDCRSHGTAMIGSKNPSASISELDVRAIRRMKTLGIPRAVIAEGYGMHIRSIFRILSNTSWEHVQ